MSYGNRYSNMFSRRTTANAAATTKLKNHHGSSIGDKHPLEANYKLYNDMFPAFLNATRASYNALFGETELAQRVRNYFDTNQVVLFVNANGKFHQDFKKSSTSFDIAATIKAEFHLMVDDDKHPMMIYRDHQSAPLFLVVARNIHVVADLVRLFGCPCVLQMDYNIPHEDINGVMDLLEDVARQGREWSQFITDFLWYLRNLLLVGQGNAAEEALEVSTDQLKLLQEKAQQVEENTLIRYIRILSELLERIRYATSKRVLVEVEMMKMCRPQMEADTNSLADRVRQLEQQLEQLLQSGIPVQQAAQAGQNQIALQQEVKSEQDPVKQLNEKFPPAKVEELIELVNHWRDVKRNLSPQMKYCLQRATLSVNEEGTALRVLFPKEMNVESGYFLEEPERIERL
jgi:hypothetical protein